MAAVWNLLIATEQELTVGSYGPAVYLSLLSTMSNPFPIMIKASDQGVRYSLAAMIP